MRIPFLSLFVTSPFDGLHEHAEKVKECAWAFQQAVECHFTKNCKAFEQFREDVNTLESQADAIKRRIRGHIPKGTLLPVDKFQMFRYLREQDQVLDAVEDALEWLAYRSQHKIPIILEKDIFKLVDAVIDPIEILIQMVDEARKSGLWKKSDSQKIPLKMPVELKTALEKNKKARKFFDTLAPSYKKQFIGWIAVAKRPETRERRLKEAIALLERRKKLGMK